MVIRQEALVKKGFEVDVAHKVENLALRHEDGTPYYVKAITFAMITKDGISGFGEARCSRLDQFNKKRGFQIAVGRALKAWAKKAAETAYAPQSHPAMKLARHLREGAVRG